MKVHPLIRRSIIEPLWAIKSGTPLLRHWRELEESQFLSEKQLRERQWARLKMMVEFAFLNNAYYRRRFQEYGIRLEEIKTPEDLRKAPILTKKEIRGHGEQLISNGFNRSHLMEAKTGGSTGTSLKLYLTEECSELKNACARRHNRWSGWEVGEPVAAVWGNPVYPVGLKEKLRDALLSPTIYLDTMALTEEAVKKFAADWGRVRPTLLFGHAHSIYLLAKMVLETGIHGIAPKGVISSSMMLLPHERAVIERVFCVKVFDRYGCEEVGLISSECGRHEGMHINIDHLFVEFIKEDGTPAQPGELGAIVVTDLINKAMPFIRYRIEDMGVPLDRKCPCGRELPMMENVAGRVADFLVKKDGTRIAGISLIENSLTRIPGIEQMQIVQNDRENIIVNIVPDDHFSSENKRELIRYFSKTFGSDMQIDLREVPEIQAERNGKYRFSICRVDK